MSHVCDVVMHVVGVFGGGVRDVVFQCRSFGLSWPVTGQRVVHMCKVHGMVCVCV